MKFDISKILKEAKKISEYHATGYIKDIKDEDFPITIYRDKPTEGNYKFCKVKIEIENDLREDDLKFLNE